MEFGTLVLSSLGNGGSSPKGDKMRCLQLSQKITTNRIWLAVIGFKLRHHINKKVKFQITTIKMSLNNNMIRPNNIK